MALVAGDERPPLVELRGVGLRYGVVEALADVSLAIRAGEVLGLVGDNGAGKSSLVSVVAGVHPPAGGETLLDGRPVRLAGPRDALERGIATIHQHLALVPLLPVWQNLFLGAELTRGPSAVPLRLLDKPRMRRESRALLDRLAIRLPDVDARVETLSGGQRQAVAIARALLWNARLLIMDEPTAALGVKETGEVLQLVRDLKHRGVAVLLVSHDMQDVVAVADRVAILKKGRLVATVPAAQLDADRLARMILTTQAA